MEKNLEMIQTLGKLTRQQFSELLLKLHEEGKTEEVQEATYARCATDIQLFARIYFPHYCNLAFNAMHRTRFKEFKYSARGRRRALAAPRGYAKSVFAVLVEPIHAICYGLERYICIFSNTDDQAVAKVKDIRTELLGNAPLIADYGIRFADAKPAKTSFVVWARDHDCQVSAFGAGAELRGVRYKEHRPSLIILDDFEHSEHAQKETLRDKERARYFEVISNLGNPETNVDYVGTILHSESLLSHLLKNPAYDGRLYKSVISWSQREDLWAEWERIYWNIDSPTRKEDADAFYAAHEPELLKGVQVLWPEKEPYYYLMKEIAEKGKRAFMKEKQNTPLGHDDQVFETIHYFQEVKEGLKIEESGVIIPWGELKFSAYGVCDPATGKVKAKAGSKGDFTCILVGYKDNKGRLFVFYDYTRREAPTKWISEIFELEQQLPDGFVKFGVETNLYRNLLLPNLVDERKRREQEAGKIVKVPFYDIEQTENKEKRIYQLEPKVSHGWILFNRALSKEAMGQLQEFPHAEHDDFPDAVEMLWGLANNRYDAGAVNKNINKR